MSEAVVRTILYADIFDYPLTALEIHRYLIGYRASLSAVVESLSCLDGLGERLVFRPPYWLLAGREGIIKLRRERETIAGRLWPAAHSNGQAIAAIPFVRMVGLTGSLAMNNVSSAHDDIDYLIITQHGRVWLARAMIVLWVRLAGRRGLRLCPNYMLSERNLVLHDRSLYTAHELAQMWPLHGDGLYQSLFEANAWLVDCLPNASPHRHTDQKMGSIRRLCQSVGEALLGGSLGDAVDQWECERKTERLFRQATQDGGGGATFTRDLCKGHMADHAYQVMQTYRDRLVRHGLLSHTHEDGTDGRC